VVIFNVLKLNVFPKWPLGGLRARFWRPRASISEPPSLDFGGSELDFRRFETLLVETPGTTPLDSTLSVSEYKCLDPIGCGGLRVAVSINERKYVAMVLIQGTVNGRCGKSTDHSFLIQLISNSIFFKEGSAKARIKAQN